MILLALSRVNIRTVQFIGNLSSIQKNGFTWYGSIKTYAYFLSYFYQYNPAVGDTRMPSMILGRKQWFSSTTVFTL